MNLEFLNAYKIPIILGSVSVFCIVLSIILLVISLRPAAPIEFSSDTLASASAQIKIDVEGAVNAPGMYSLPASSRVEDAIAAAGGLSREVDDDMLAKTINRAMKLVDGGKIFIPTHADAGQSTLGSVSSLISLNAGSQGELESLPGVGPATAKKIIDNRPYQTLEELVSKKAVGAALFEKIKNQISP